MEELPTPKFTFPQEFVKKIYKLTGGESKNKGFIMFYIDSGGEPAMMIPTGMDTSVLFALRKCAEVSLNRMDEMDIQGYVMEKTGMFDGEE